MAKRRKRTTRKKKMSPLTLFLLVIISLLILWVGAFVWSTGTWWPDVRSGGLPGREASGWDAESQQELDDLMVRKMLVEKGSRGPQEPSP